MFFKVLREHFFCACVGKGTARTKGAAHKESDRTCALKVCWPEEFQQSIRRILKPMRAIHRLSLFLWPKLAPVLSAWSTRPMARWVGRLLLHFLDSFWHWSKLLSFSFPSHCSNNAALVAQFRFILSHSILLSLAIICGHVFY